MKNINKMLTISLLVFMNITTQLQSVDKKSSDASNNSSKKTKGHHNSQSATDEEKKSSIQTFLKSIEKIPKHTQNNHKEYKESVKKARDVYQKMYEFTTKKPFVLTESEYKKIKKMRKHLSHLETELKKSELTQHPSKHTNNKQDHNKKHEHSDGSKKINHNKKHHKTHKNH